MNRTAFATALAAALALGACTTDVLVDDGTNPAVVTALDRDFDAAASETGVPVDLLKAVSYVETRWEMVTGEVEHDGVASGVGVMALRPEMLDRGAALAGVSREEVEQDPAANIRAAAFLLAEEARAQGVAGDNLAAWMPVLEAWSGIGDDEARAAYVRDGVFAVLRTGVSEQAESGEMIATLSPRRDLPTFITGGVHNVAGPDYPAAVWRASPNFNARPAGNPVSIVVIHSCEGGYAGCWGTLRSTAAGVSAHYVVNESGSEVTQLVREASRAWHVAATYDCSRAGNQQCGKNGGSTNNFSVGIEHAGYASQATWSNGLIEASAKLTCNIAKDNGVPRDRNHIVSHGQLQPWNRTDPGPNWPWAHYIDRVRTICGDNGGGGGGGGGGGTPTPPATIIVDSNNANNNASVARIELTGTWNSASATPGYYGSGYWFADTSTTAAPATFFFYLPAAQSRIVEAWWTAGTNRSTQAKFIATNAAGTQVGTVTKNQTTQGSQWVSLGTWQFSAGWNKVALSRQAPGGKVVVADAIRVR